MKRYQIWNKIDTIYTPGVGKDGKGEFTPQEWLAKFPWAKNPAVKMIISAGAINGGCAMELEATKESYRKMGASITDDMTDEEVLRAIEAFEDTPPKGEPSAEERIAAQLEFQSMML